MIECGELFGIYETLEEMPYRTKYNERLYRLRCTICGFEKISIIQKTREPHTCRHIDITHKYIDRTQNSVEDRALSKILSFMKQRCYNPNSKSYKYYGGKGIYICEEWLNNKREFAEWAHNNGYHQGLSIDRIDPNGPYSPSNCRWVTAKNNAKYKSTTNTYTVAGLSMTGREWADYLEIGTNTINIYVRKYGEEETLKFIEWFLSHPEIKSKKKHHIPYFNIFQNATS